MAVAFIKHLVTFVDDLDVLGQADRTIGIRWRAVACDTGKRNAIKVQYSPRHAWCQEASQRNKLVLEGSVGLVKMLVWYFRVLILFLFAFPWFAGHGLHIAQRR